MGKMKAIIFTNYGSVEVLQLKEVEKTPPLDNEVLINIFATSVTASDCSIRGFKLPLSMWNPGRLTSGITKPGKDILKWIYFISPLKQLFNHSFKK